MVEQDKPENGHSIVSIADDSFGKPSWLHVTDEQIVRRNQRRKSRAAEKGWEKTGVEEREGRTVPGTRDRISYQLDGNPITKQLLPLSAAVGVPSVPRRVAQRLRPVPTGWGGVNVRPVPRPRPARNSAACGAGGAASTVMGWSLSRKQQQQQQQQQKQGIEALPFRGGRA
ncbi:hypothetical protein CFIO01_00487 [Colletotrichum fioriniae PJ7]|uniref:Uncharacterized protein n=1 Tax=Colletotrichum fioriniae PJ7 TaxID=1445577 RepID=A0A010Q855_9PEZI|nr:hypothetical protein CFIO01_00487 [Colletotrichum fioriniae PJ7]